MTARQGDQPMVDEPPPDVAANLRAVRQRIDDAARAAGRDPQGITLVAVSKTIPAPIVAAAVAVGACVLGENRVQEAEEKVPEVRRILSAASSAGTPPPGGAGVPPALSVLDPTGYPTPVPRWHLIGHLQTNKAKAAVALFEMLQSVDSLRLAQEIDRRAREAGVRPTVLWQVNVAGEQSKGGFSPDDLRRAVPDLARLEGLAPGGLMTIAPLMDDQEGLRGVFRGLRLLFEEVAGAFPGSSWRHLSMGMTNDFELAIAEGATLVRIGRAIFGQRG